MKKHNPYFYLAIILFGQFLFPVFAYADAGISLVWAGVSHLVIGNLLIGILEGTLIAKIFKARLLKSILIMALANYISMFLGFVGMGAVAGLGIGVAGTINHAVFIVLLFLGTYGFSVLIEWPFCFWVLSRQQRRGIRSLQASVLVQTVSYVILIIIYLGVGFMALKENPRLHHPASSSAASNKN